MTVSVVSFFSGPQFIRASRGPLRPGVAFLTTSRLQLRPIFNFNSPKFCSIRRPYITFKLPRDGMDKPPQFLPISGDRDVSLPLSMEWPVWSSSSGNNCHAVQRSLSSGASVYDSIMGFFYLVPFHQPISAQAISSHNCHENVSLPSGASPWMAFLAGCMTVISAWWRLNIRFQRSSGRRTII